MIKSIIWQKLFLVLLLAGATIARAADEKKPQFKKTQEVTFEASEVDGAVRSPDGAYVNPKKGMKFMPLFKVNQQFDKEIKDSVEYLK